MHPTPQKTGAVRKNEETAMRISFVIPAFNEEHYIGECLRSIVDLKDPAVHEIIVVDNGSTDNTAAIARSFAGVTVVHEEHKGLTWARQKGLDTATGDYYAAIDADVRVPPQWLDVVKRRFRDPELASLTGPYRYFDLARWKQSIIRFLLWLIVTAHRIAGSDAQLSRGGNTVYRMQTLRAAGGFNTKISFYGEDIDTLIRVHTRGKTDYDPGMFAWSSARRINAEGFWKSLFLYRLSSVWQHIAHKPLLRKAEFDWR